MASMIINLHISCVESGGWFVRVELHLQPGDRTLPRKCKSNVSGDFVYGAVSGCSYLYSQYTLVDKERGGRLAAMFCFSYLYSQYTLRTKQRRQVGNNALQGESKDNDVMCYPVRYKASHRATISK